MDVVFFKRKKKDYENVLVSLGLHSQTTALAQWEDCCVWLILTGITVL